MKKYIIIKADTNDGDYIYEKSEITDEIIEKIRPVIQAIKNFQPYIGKKPDYWNYEHGHNYPSGDACRNDLGEKTPFELYGNIPGFELFDQYVPYGEYGIHTIESIEIINVANEEKLL